MNIKKKITITHRNNKIQRTSKGVHPEHKTRQRDSGNKVKNVKVDTNYMVNR